MRKTIFFTVVVFISSIITFNDALALNTNEISVNSDLAIKNFKNMTGCDDLIKRAKGLLVFPAVYKAGIGIGAEYGEGALFIKGKAVDYYSTASASIGLQLGAQRKTIIIAFMKDDALKSFRQSTGWKIGLDASVTVIAVGAGASIDSESMNKPIVAFVMDQKGLMYNMTLEGTKITKICK